MNNLLKVLRFITYLPLYLVVVTFSICATIVTMSPVIDMKVVE